MPKIRVLVVDDAVVMRKLITEVLNHDPHLEVVGAASNGRLALQRIPQVNPDIITLDVEMPEMDGVATMREIRKLYPRLPVIMFSTLTQRGAETTLDALAAGANDYVTKAANVGSVMEGISRLENELIPKIKVLCPGLIPREAAAGALPPVPHRAAPPAVAMPPASGKKTVEVVCLGTSTGGPTALVEVLGAIPAPLPVPVVMVQHMPPLFTKMLAERLTQKCCMPCHEAQEGQPILAGQVYLAPGGKHMEVRRESAAVRARLHEGPPENSCRPAVDVLFRSVVAVYGPGILSVIMTGMGQDGYRGCQLVRERGGQVVVQDEATSVVWGMPGYVAQAGLADAIVPLAQIGSEITRRVRSGYHR